MLHDDSFAHFGLKIVLDIFLISWKYLLSIRIAWTSEMTIFQEWIAKIAFSLIEANWPSCSTESEFWQNFHSIAVNYKSLQRSYFFWILVPCTVFIWKGNMFYQRKNLTLIKSDYLHESTLRIYQFRWKFSNFSYQTM